MQVMNKWILLVFVCFIWVGSSCSGDRAYEEFHSFESVSWNEKDSVVFNLSELKERNGKNLIAVRFTGSFPFSNFYVRVISKDSTGIILENKLINIPLFDSKTGKPKGIGFGDTYTFYDTLPFQVPANTDKLIYLQYMRNENIPGIEAIGFKVLKD